MKKVINLFGKCFYIEFSKFNPVDEKHNTQTRANWEASKKREEEKEKIRLFAEKNPDVKTHHVFHGGCLGCTTPLNEGIGKCLGCRYSNWNLELPDLSNSDHKRKTK